MRRSVECPVNEAQAGGRVFMYENDQSKSDTVVKKKKKNTLELLLGM